MSLLRKDVTTPAALKLVIVTLVVVFDDCFCRKTTASGGFAATTGPGQFQLFAAAGIVIVQAEPGVVPTLTWNDAVPLDWDIDAPEPPHPAPAIVGAAASNNALVKARLFIDLREPFASICPANVQNELKVLAATPGVAANT